MIATVEDLKVCNLDTGSGPKKSSPFGVCRLPKFERLKPWVSQADPRRGSTMSVEVDGRRYVVQELDRVPVPLLTDRGDLRLMQLELRALKQPDSIVFGKNTKQVVEIIPKQFFSEYDAKDFEHSSCDYYYEFFGYHMYQSDDGLTIRSCNSSYHETIPLSRYSSFEATFRACTDRICELVKNKRFAVYTQSKNKLTDPEEFADEVLSKNWSVTEIIPDEKTTSIGSFSLERKDDGTFRLHCARAKDFRLIRAIFSGFNSVYSENWWNPLSFGRVTYVLENEGLAHRFLREITDFHNVVAEQQISFQGRQKGEFPLKLRVAATKGLGVGYATQERDGFFVNSGFSGKSVDILDSLTALIKKMCPDAYNVTARIQAEQALEALSLSIDAFLESYGRLASRITKDPNKAKELPNLKYFEIVPVWNPSKKYFNFYITKTA